MAKLVSLFISQTHQRLVFLALWVAMFAATLLVFAAVTANQVGESLRAVASSSLEPSDKRRETLLEVFDSLDAQLTAEPCSDAFQAQWRKVAFRPDGLSEFFYGPGGVVQCSISMGRFPEPANLGPPDIETADPEGYSVWLDRGLDFAGLPGLTGTIAMRGSFGIITAPQRLSEVNWMDQEVVRLSENGEWFHRNGDSGVYERVLRAQNNGSLLPDQHGAFHELVCDPDGFFCVAAEATVPRLLRLGLNWVLVGVLAAALIAASLASHFHAIFKRFWSFEARFCRNFNAGTVVCVYQPIIAVATGEVAGCEVLVRWRDLDGAITTPDKFLPIVERRGMTMLLTTLVVERAARELSSRLPPGRRLQVLFNVFPRDLDCERLIEVLSVFDPVRDRFDLVVELIESDQISVDSAPREVAALRAQGIKTYIDDFGTGYSNIANLAVLSVDGVKLDRAFAMSPDGTLMAQLLTNIIDMIHGAGCAIVVEGIETAKRLETVRATGRVEYAQGYFLSRPLDIGQLAAFLAAREKVPVARPVPRLAAVS